MIYFLSILFSLIGGVATANAAGTYFTTPAVTTTLTGIAEWFNPIFSDFWLWGLIAIGVSLVFAIIGWLIRHFHGGLHH